MMNNKTLGQFIRVNRLAMGLTQEQLANQVGEGIRQSDISRLEQERVEFPR
ncbi:MAG: helix-turn-helix domain-containing protein, partial [Chloroflexia bacterium]|nr:helix-turn-helix domain-containing protein [Chloroflexia bacterium]